MKKWLVIITVFVLVSGALGTAWYVMKSNDKPPLILIVGDQYNFGGGQEKDLWGYRKPLQDLLGKGTYDFIGPNTFPNDAAGYDADTYAEFYRRIGICKVDLKHSLPKLMKKAPQGSWIIIFIGAADITKQRVTPKFVAQDILTMVKDIHRFNPDIGVIVARLPPPRTKMYDPKIVKFNRLVFEYLQDLWYQTEKKNLFIPDLYNILTSVPGWKRRVLGKTLFPTPLGWQIIAETFTDIVQGKGRSYADYIIPEDPDALAQKNLLDNFERGYRQNLAKQERQKQLKLNQKRKMMERWQDKQKKKDIKMQRKKRRIKNIKERMKKWKMEQEKK